MLLKSASTAGAPARVRGTSLGTAAAFAVAPLLAGGILATGRIQFGGMDGGALSNAAWQMHLGYQPYNDFITAVPPTFLVGSRLALVLFGVHWLAFVSISALFAAVTYCLHFLLLRRAGLPIPASVAVATMTQLFATVPGGFWWYNSTTEILACLFFAAFLGWPRQSRFDVPTTVFGGLLLLSKPNVALPLLGLASIYLFTQRGWRKTLAVYTGIGLLVLVLLRLFNFPLSPLLRNYRTASGRAFSFESLLRFLIFNQRWEVEQTTLLLLPALAGLLLLLVLASRPRAGRHIAPVAIGFVCTAIATCTNNSLNFSELPLALTGVAFALGPLYVAAAPDWRRNVAIAAIALTAIGLSLNAIRVAASRLLIREVGVHQFYEDAPLAEIKAPPYFAGVSASRTLAETLRELDDLFPSCPSCPDRDGEIFIGPRIDFAYAAYGIKPHPGMPLWWEPFTDGSLPASRAMVERFRNAHFQVAVFARNDFTFLPQSVIDYLNAKYDVTSTPYLTIYRARN